MADRWYGRQQARPLRPRQQALLDEVLPRLTLPSTGPVDPATLFGGAPVWLEVGCGGGEHAAWQADHHRAIGMIACEPFINGIASLLGHVVAHDLTNLKVWPHPAQDLLDRLTPASITRAFVLFPDPWPKLRHNKRRFLQAANLDRLARILAPGAELRVGTDHADYLTAILAAFAVHPAFRWTATRADDWRIRPADWPPTRYETKAAADGVRSTYLRFLRH